MQDLGAVCVGLGTLLGSAQAGAVGDRSLERAPDVIGLRL